MATADNRLMTDATGQGILTALQNLAAVQAVPYVTSIPTGQWSGSGNDWYITINASNVTANSILIPNYDKDSSELLNGPVWCVPAAGSFTIHTSAIPAGTVTIMVMFAGTMGEAQYQILDDVYSKAQTDALVAQSTAPLTAREDLTVTYTQNQYVTSSDLGITVKRVGKAYAIDGNLWLSNEYSADSPVEICRINNYNAAKPIRIQIPNGANTMLITIYDNGIIALGRVSSSLVRGWYRFGATAVKWD